MINILDKNSIKGKTIYVVYRSGREIPAQLLCIHIPIVGLLSTPVNHTVME